MTSLPPTKTRGARVYTRRPLPERFWEKVDKREAHACWPWQGARSGNGYGSFTTVDRRVAAHHLAWELANDKEVPPGMEVCHACDVRACCNPAHLFIGTRGDNMRDAAAKGRLIQQRAPRRMPRGETHPRAKLTQMQVDEIRRRARDGALPKVLAAEFGVTGALISMIVRGKIWRDSYAV